MADRDSRIPAQVVKQGEEADRRIQEIKDGQKGTGTITKPAPPAAAPPVGTPDPVTPAGNGQKPSSGEAAPVPAPVVPDTDQAKRVEAGRLKKMSEENAQLKAKMAEKDTLIVNLNSQLYSRPPVPAPRETVPEPEPKSTVDDELEALSQEMEQDFGKNAMRWMELTSAKEARQAVDSRIDPISEDITRDREGRFVRELDGLVPDLDLLNNDAEFIAWLSQKDARSGMSYHDLLNQSYQARDANRVALFFDDYKQSIQTPDPNGVTSDLEDQIVPDSVRSTTAPTPSEPVTAPQIKRHYDREIRESGYKDSDEYIEFDKRMRATVKSGQI